MRPMSGSGRPGGAWIRRFAASACALGVLFALPAAANAKEVAVAVSLKVLVGNTAPNNCAAAAYLQWPAQAGAEKWRLEYLWNGKLEKRNPKPPFDDAPHSTYGWAPPGGSHWYLASIGSKSASEEAEPVDCGDHEAARLNAFGGGTIFITVPDDPDDDESDDDESDGEDSDDDRPDPPGEDEVEVPPPPKAGAPKCRGQAVTIFAQPGTPTNGTPRRDVILGTPARDVIRARGGNDLVCALPGNDTVLGGGGRDVLLGQGGADTLHGQAGRDTLLGGAGADRIFGQAAADRLFGQAGSDLLNGGAGRPDLCNGGPGRDQPRSPGCERRRLIP